MEEKGKYETFMQNWFYENLPNSEFWCIIQDIDFIIQNLKTKRFLIIELKTRWNKVTYSQRKFYSMLNKRLAKTNWSDWWTYVWTNLLSFEWDNFYDWKVTLNWNKTDEYQLQQFFYDNLWLYSSITL